MVNREFETMVGFHCSPVLAGLKISNLVSFSKEKMPEIPDLVREYNVQLKKKNLKLEIVCSCRKHFLVLLYRPDLMERYLNLPGNAVFLKKDGYRPEWRLDEKLALLKKRLALKTETPHEIGLFLGYPLEDVEGFRKYKGAGYKLCGYWKVYGDAEKARRRFAAFDRSRAYFGKQIENGWTLTELLSPGEIRRYIA